MVPAGLLLHQVRVERRAAVADDYGNVMGGWAPLATRRAALRLTRGRERIAAGAQGGEVEGVLTLRADAATLAVTAADRIVILTAPHAGAVAGIRAVIPAPDGHDIDIQIALDAAG